MDAKNIQNLCRTCANKEDNMTLINSSLIVNNNVVIIAKLLEMFNIQTKKGFPTVICPVCIEKVLNAQEFRMQCQKSTVMFEHILQTETASYTSDNDGGLDNNGDNKYIAFDSNSVNDSEVDFCKTNCETKVFIREHTNSDIEKINGNTASDFKESMENLKNYQIIEKETSDDDQCDRIVIGKCKTKKLKTQTDSKPLKEKILRPRKQIDDTLLFCAECNKSFKNKYILVSHVKRHRNRGQFLCNVCGKGFNAQSCLSRHSRVHTGEKKYECNVCHKKFPSSNNLTLHSRRHSGVKPYLCTLCGKCFSHPTGLTYHIRTHTKEKPYACDVCGRRFTIQCHRERHKKTHSGERPFACNMCDKAFIKKFDLQRHQDVHLGNKPHVCSICNKAFVRKMHLNYHMMVHTKERPHVCNYCGKGFIRRYYLTSHVKKHHTFDVDYNSTN